MKTTAPLGIRFIATLFRISAWLWVFYGSYVLFDRGVFSPLVFIIGMAGPACAFSYAGLHLKKGHWLAYYGVLGVFSLILIQTFSKACLRYVSGDLSYVLWVILTLPFGLAVIYLLRPQTRSFISQARQNRENMARERHKTEPANGARDAQVDPSKHANNLSISRTVLRAALKASAIMVLSAGALYSMSYYFFGYPRAVAERALASVHKGQSLEEVLRPDSIFMSHLNKNRFGATFHLGTKNDNPCYGKIEILKANNVRLTLAAGMDEKGNVQNYIWQGTTQQMPQLLKKHQSKITQCTEISATFMPAYLYRCTVKMKFDENYIIQDFGKPECWD